MPPWHYSSSACPVTSISPMPRLGWASASVTVPENSTNPTVLTSRHDRLRARCHPGSDLNTEACMSSSHALSTCISDHPQSCMLRLYLRNLPMTRKACMLICQDQPHIREFPSSAEMSVHCSSTGAHSTSRAGYMLLTITCLGPIMCLKKSQTPGFC